ncbi:MAG: Stp1/IreP family PP2C-type Ser/Thr phosphatase [Alkalibacterium sp.]|nr:Stp1/IreP family PP2C-type Ser/Thr phosphatase [Alkalibacterium sp.]TVP92498.1 MAG: Stp1/IreP family PP2C-type Ser/Thr phosphatase [Alkalibacterium sp.]
MNTFKQTHIGLRSTNQDYVELFYNEKNHLLAVLCDGMGGHKAGDIASEMAVLQLGNEWTKTAFETAEETRQWLTSQINIENQRIYRVSKTYSDLQGMGTTLVTAAFLDDEIVIGNIGDSRAYQWKSASEEFNLITTDHSFANELRLSGQITAEEAKTHSQRHMLTRSLGVFDKVTVDFFGLKKNPTDLILLCSDGLSNGLSNEEMKTIVAMNDTLESKAEKLTESALNNGSTDNITVCLIETDASVIKGKEE